MSDSDNTLTIVLVATIALVIFVLLGKSCYEHFTDRSELATLAEKVQGIVKIEAFEANTYSDADLKKMIRAAEKINKNKGNIMDFEKESGFELEPLVYAHMMDSLRKGKLDVRRLREIILSNGMQSRGLRT